MTIIVQYDVVADEYWW